MLKCTPTCSAVVVSLLSVFSFSATGFADSIIPTEVVDFPDSTQTAHPAASLFDGSYPIDVSATRLNDRLPIITKQLFVDEGFAIDSHEAENINGPSLIRVPDWIDPDDRADTTAQYYLYFGHHHGNFIPMAWAANIEGPYTLYNASPGNTLPNQGVLGLNEDDELDIGGGISAGGHIASPDVLVDDENERIIMYFHAPSKTYVATSPYGLDFNGQVEPIIIGDQYMRMFEWDGDLYGSAWDEFFKAPSLSDPWTSTDPDYDSSEDYVWEEDRLNFWRQHFIDTFDGSLSDPSIDPTQSLRIRHTDILVDGDTLHVFYSRKDDMAERIVHSEVYMDPDFEAWTVGDTLTELLQPEEVWEGIEFPNEISTGGSADDSVRQLRDPDVFVDADGSKYLLYSGQGEDAIGIASLEMEQNGLDDGDRWSASGLQSGPLAVILDLGVVYDISSVTLYPQSDRDYQYIVQLSNLPDSGFSTAVDRSANTEAADSITDSVSGASGRYVRLEIQGAATYSGNWASIRELLIEGTVSAIGCDLPFNEADVSITNGEVDVSFGPYNISCVDGVVLSMDVASVGNLENTDSVNVYYSVDGGPEIALLENKNSISPQTISASGISGNSLEVRIVGETSNDNEFYEVTNIAVVESCDLSISEEGFSISDEEVEVDFGPYDISCASEVTLSMDVDSTGSLENRDYLNVYYSIDGGPEVALLENDDSISSQTISVSGLSGSSLEVRVHGETSNDNEIYDITNISVVD